MLGNVTDILLASGAKHVIYALTTPYQADSLPACGPYCNVPNATSSFLSPLGMDSEWPQPTDGGNGRCGPPQCEAGSLGCGVPNETAKQASPDPNAPGCGPPTYAVTVLNNAAKGVMASRGVPTLDLNSVIHASCGANYSYCDLCKCGCTSASGGGILREHVASHLPCLHSSFQVTTRRSTCELCVI